MAITPVTPYPGTPPNSNDPATFNVRADVAYGFLPTLTSELVTFATQANEAADQISGDAEQVALDAAQVALNAAAAANSESQAEIFAAAAGAAIGLPAFAGNATKSLAVNAEEDGVEWIVNVPATRLISAGDGLSGGGDLTADRTLSVNSTVVRTSGAQTIDGVKTFSSTIVGNISGNAATATTATNCTRQVIAGDGLSGGGALTADRTLAVDGTVVRTSGDQTIAGTKTFSSTISGSINGNAATANTWTTSRTITLGGDLSGSVSLDGSENVLLTATINNQKPFQAF